jgi:rubrerythrin
MFDDPKTVSSYECFECGTIVDAESVPGSCPECGSEYRNRSMALE